MPSLKLPTLHPGQVDVLRLPGKRKTLRCGRRWGKTALFITTAASVTLRGGYCGWFAPDYKIQQEAWRDTYEILQPVIKSASKSEKVIELITGGRIEFWTLDNERAGRSRKYHYVFGDEIAFAPDNMQAIWELAIEPTLIDFSGSAMLGSTPNGRNSTNFFYSTCTDKSLGWAEYHAPSWSNPHIPRADIEKIKAARAKPVFDQEYGAEFVDWSSSALFIEAQLLVNGNPVAVPTGVDYVFAVMDTTAKGGDGKDGTGITFFAYASHPQPGSAALVILDWDLLEIEADLISGYLPQVYQRLNQYAGITRAQAGSIGLFIEDKAAGIVLLQQAKRCNSRLTHAIDSKLTSLGKDARALNASSYFAQSMVKITQAAYDKTSLFRTISRNHLVGQLTEFRIGESGKKRQDDLFDTAMYGAAIALGNNEGF